MSGWLALVKLALQVEPRRSPSPPHPPPPLPPFLPHVPLRPLSLSPPPPSLPPFLPHLPVEGGKRSVEQMPRHAMDWGTQVRGHAHLVEPLHSRVFGTWLWTKCRRFPQKRWFRAPALRAQRALPSKEWWDTSFPRLLVWHGANMILEEERHPTLLVDLTAYVWRYVSLMMTSAYDVARCGVTFLHSDWRAL